MVLLLLMLLLLLCLVQSDIVDSYRGDLCHISKGRSEIYIGHGDKNCHENRHCSVIVTGHTPTGSSSGHWSNTGGCCISGSDGCCGWCSQFVRLNGCHFYRLSLSFFLLIGLIRYIPLNDGYNNVAYLESSNAITVTSDTHTSRFSNYNNEGMFCSSKFSEFKIVKRTFLG